MINMKYKHNFYPHQLKHIWTTTHIWFSSMVLKLKLFAHGLNFESISHYLAHGLLVGWVINRYSPHFYNEPVYFFCPSK